jgi:nucleoid DNA-binding protein
MAKLTIQDLATMLAEKNELTIKEATEFVSAIFEVIQVGIEKDKLVKVKGLGTFKVIDVEARESVNVNNGERVLIDGHSKISFTPDATMKELVNKPFSGFETVVLNEGVEFDDMPTKETAEETLPETEPVVQPELEPQSVVLPEPEPEVNEEKTKEEENVAPKIEEPVVPQVEEPIAPQVEEPAAIQEESVVAQPEPPIVEFVDENEGETTSGQSWCKWMLVIVLCLVIGFVGGFFVGRYSPELACFCGSSKTDTEIVKEPMLSDSLTTDSTKAIPTDSAVIVKDTIKVAPVDTVKKSETKPEAPKPVVDQSYKKYDEMDSRVRTGAYVIVGLDQTVKAREGDNVARVSRRYLGEGMSCYVEVYNGMTATTQLKAGQEVKLPKLKLRKSMKEQKKENQK